MRTKYCGHVTESDINNTITLCGWVHRKRNFGNFMFIDVRDCTGILQVLFRANNHRIFHDALKLKLEFCIQVTGIVKTRISKNQNIKIKTGLIEVIASILKIINTAKSLPIDINKINEEKVRFKYRYLDLRQLNMFKNLKIRHDITNDIRNFLNKNHFLNIETPMLSKSTPEGAKEYLVPSRIHRNQYYALPQSPQIFKQLCMISGIDKYYQIVKCFRDEDLRSDRQPEFTQIDIEAAFINDKYIKNLTELMIKMLWKNFLDYDIQKIPVMKFHDAINMYGSDKPDLRNPIKLYQLKQIHSVKYNNKFNENISTVALVIPNSISLLKKDKTYILNQEINKYNITYYFYIYIKDINKKKYNIIYSLDIFKTDYIMEIIKSVHANNNDIILIISGMKNNINQLSYYLRKIIAEKINIIDYTSWKPVWIIDFPMFKKDHNNILSAIHHPFTSPKNINFETLKDIDPELIIANSYDLVINGYELGGGSVRIHDPKIQTVIFNMLNISIKQESDPFYFFVNALKYGTPPHAGIALGLDRIVMLLTKNKNIKNVIAFPKTNTATCLMTGAPTKCIF